MQVGPPKNEPLRIALAQVDCILGNIEANADRAREQIARARAENAHLIVFPELSLVGYALGDLVYDVALRADDPTIAALAAEAGEMAVAIGFAEQGPVHTYNSVIYLHGNRSVHVQRKAFLPTYGRFDERKHFSPGQRMTAFDSDLGRFAMLICNDAWQPPLAFIAVHDGARLLLVPASSSISTTGSDQTELPTDWRALLHFYGRFLQTYIVFVNRVGQEADRTFWGGSQVVDPEGRVVIEAPMYEPDLVIADIDLEAVRRIRRASPLLKEARLGLLLRELGRLAQDDGDH